MFNDRDLLAKTLQAEAGNQGLGGMLAVGNVIFNRIDQSNSNLQDVILSPGQFSAWNKYTNYAGGEQGQDMVNLEPSKNAYAAADALLSGNFVDITGGATHYYNPDISQPSWGAQSGGNWKTIGSHLFGKAGSFNEGSQTMAEELTAQDLQNLQQQTLRPQGLMGFLRDPRTRQILSSFSRSRVGERLGEIADRDRELQIAKDEDNKTARFLMSQPQGVKYARAILEGGLSGAEAYSQFLAETQRAGTKVGERIIDPVTGKIIYEGSGADQLSKDQVGVVAQLNGQLRQIYRPYDEIFNGYNLIKNAISRAQDGQVTSGIDDLTVTIAFAKILDPESVVRSEESAAVSRAGGGINAAINAFKNFLTGEGLLADDVRQRIFKVASDTAKTWYNKSLEEYERVLKTASLYGIPDNIAKEVISKPREMTITPIPSSNENPEQPNGPIPQSAIDAGLTQEDWNVMNEREREPFL